MLIGAKDHKQEQDLQVRFDNEDLMLKTVPLKKEEK